MPARGPSGFTLLELLLAMTLLALIAVMLAGGLRLGARVWESGEERAQALARLELVQGFLRRQVSGARPLVMGRLGSQPRYAFEGGRERLRLAVLAPPQLGAGGFYLVTIERAEGQSGVGEGDELRLGWQLYHPEMDEVGASDPVTERVLLEGVEKVKFSYFGALRRDPEPRWRERWEDQRALPELVRIELEFRDPSRYWPQFVAAPKVLR
jgi:general secretion pathway protein J